MSAGTICASVSALLLILLAGAAWVVFIGGFGAHNTDMGFFDKLGKVNQLPPEAAAQGREILFHPYYAHYIIASASPLLFIVMLVKAVLMMVLKNKTAACVSIIISIPIFILAGLVLISMGFILYTYGVRIIGSRTTGNSLTATEATMFSGVVMETVFLIAALMLLYSSTVCASVDRK